MPLLFAGEALMAILSALYNQDRSALQIMEAVDKATKGKIRISQGSIYTQLQRLERAGLVVPRYGTERPKERQGNRRRYYRITGAGMKVRTYQDLILNWGLNNV